MWTKERIIFIFLAVALCCLVVVPLLFVFESAFHEETGVGLSKNYSPVAFYDVYLRLKYLIPLFNALLLALFVTVLSLFVGTTMAFLVSRTDIGAKKVLDLLIIMPMFFSAFTGLIAWVALGSSKTGFLNIALNGLFSWMIGGKFVLFNIWSYLGIVWVMFLFFCPYAYLFTLGALNSMESSLEEAARMTGATYRYTLFRITLPLAMPAIFASGLVIFVLSAESYTIPGMIGRTIGYTTLPWKIYQDSAIAPVRLAHAAAAGTVLLWITVFGLWLQRRATRLAERFVTVSGKGFSRRLIPLGRAKWAAFIFIGLYVASADILPFGGILLSSFTKYSSSKINVDVLTLKHYYEILTMSNTLKALWNTAFLSVLSGAICVLFGFYISYLEVRQPKRATKILFLLAIIPVAIPGLIYGIGLLWMTLRTPIYGTVWVLLFAYIARNIPYGVLVSRTGILQLHLDLEQSARVVGCGPLRTLFSITIPLIKVTLISTFVFVMLTTIKELSASLLLYTQHSQVLSVITWDYMESGSYQIASAVGVIQTVIMIGLVWAVRSIFRIKLEESVKGK